MKKIGYCLLIQTGISLKTFFFVFWTEGTFFI